MKKAVLLLAFILALLQCLTAQVDSANKGSRYFSGDTIFLSQNQFKFVTSHSLALDLVSIGHMRDTIIYINGKEYAPSTLDTLSFLLQYLLARRDKVPIAVTDIMNNIIIICFDFGEGFTGIYKEFYPSGKPKVIGNYSEKRPGKKCGIWLFYSEAGSLSQKKYHKC